MPDRKISLSLEHAETVLTERFSSQTRAGSVLDVALRRLKVPPEERGGWALHQPDGRAVSPLARLCDLQLGRDDTLRIVSARE